MGTTLYYYEARNLGVEGEIEALYTMKHPDPEIISWWKQGIAGLPFTTKEAETIARWSRERALAR